MESFKIIGLNPAPFQELFLKDDQTLRRMNIRRVFAKYKPGYPCRVSLVDAEVGEELLLFPYLHIHNAGPGCYNCKAIRAAE